MSHSYTPSSSDLRSFSKSLVRVSASSLDDNARKNALTLFKEASRRVPAYRAFLKESGVRAESIRTINDFRKVPTTDKKNYIQKYSPAERSWDGKISDALLIASSSGTTGEPVFWPRGVEQEKEAAMVHDIIYRLIFEADKRTTLLLVCFPMGIYVSGMATVVPSIGVASVYGTVTVVPVGNSSKEQVVNVLKSVAGSYEQVIVASHPFFGKALIESIAEAGLPLEKYCMKFFFVSEGFSEAWRSYVKRIAHIPDSDTSRVISAYGSSEFLLMAHETPLSILFRKKVDADTRVCKEQFGTAMPPNIFQYHPTLRYFEAEGGRLFCTSRSGIPLIRYDIHDAGEVLSPSEMRSRFGALYTDALRHSPKVWSPLPFVFLDGRSDQTLVYHGANIYPEHIQQGLSSGRFFKYLTGRFVMEKVYKKNHDQRLQVVVELASDARSNNALRRAVEKHLAKELPLLSHEYADAVKHAAHDIAPRIKLLPAGTKPYFTPGVKPRYLLP